MKDWLNRSRYGRHHWRVSKSAGGTERAIVKQRPTIRFGDQPADQSKTLSIQPFEWFKELTNLWHFLRSQIRPTDHRSFEVGFLSRVELSIDDNAACSLSMAKTVRAFLSRLDERLTIGAVAPIHHLRHESLATCSSPLSPYQTRFAISDIAASRERVSAGY